MLRLVSVRVVGHIALALTVGTVYLSCPHSSVMHPPLPADNILYVRKPSVCYLFI